MALTKESMAAFIEARLAALDHSQTSEAGAAQNYRNQVLLALCQGIIDEITANAVVQTTSGAPDGEHMGKIS
jgi:hypothetical protein